MTEPRPPVPRYPDIGVLGVVPDEWDIAAWGVRHQVLTRLCLYFRVVWLEPSPYWRDGLVESGRPLIEGVAKDDSGVIVYRPGRLLSKFYRPKAVAHLSARLRLVRAARLLRERGCRRIVLYVWRPEFADALWLLPHDLSLYHVDDEYSFAFEEQPPDPREVALLKQANEVIIHSPGLLEKKGHLNPRTTWIPNGVDYDFFSRSQPEPADLSSIPHPRVGYVGVIKKQLDLALLDELCAKHSQWSFVFVGPEGTIAEDTPVLQRLKQRPNAYFLGRKLIEELPAYVQHMDVCTMCYKRNAYTDCIYPLKLHEYLAAGQPVVATPIRTLQAFAGDIGLASTAAEWSHQLAEAMIAGSRSPEQVAARRRIAQAYDWDALVERVAKLITDRLGGGRAD